jgi:recombination protein RecA
MSSSSHLDDIEKQIAKDFGLDLENSTKNLLESRKAIIPVSPKADVMLGGGIPEGSFGIISGKFKLGKTSAVLKIAANAQKIPYIDRQGNSHQRKVYYIDVEGRIKERDLRGVNGLSLDPDKWLPIRSEEGKILTAAKFLNITEQLINAKPGCVFIIDSFGALLSDNEKDATFGDRVRSDTPLLLSQFVKRICNVIPVNNSIVLGITHQIANTGNGPATTAEAGGNKIQFASDVKIKFTHKSPWTVGSGDKQTQIGQDCHAVCEWSALDGKPGSKASLKLRYGYGIDDEQEIIDLATDFGIITKKGSWYTYTDEIKGQGAEKIRDALIENPEAYKEIYNKVRKMMGFSTEDEHSNTRQQDTEMVAEG